MKMKKMMIRENRRLRELLQKAVNKEEAPPGWRERIRRMIRVG